MRPLKYPSLGDLSLVRMPTRLHSLLQDLLAELDRHSEIREPEEMLSSMIEGLQAVDL